MKAKKKPFVVCNNLQKQCKSRWSRPFLGFLFAAVELHSNQTVAKARKKLEPWFLNEENSDLSRVAHFVSAANMISP